MSKEKGITLTLGYDEHDFLTDLKRQLQRKARPQRIGFNEVIDYLRYLKEEKNGNDARMEIFVKTKLQKQKVAQ